MHNWEIILGIGGCFLAAVGWKLTEKWPPIPHWIFWIIFSILYLGYMIYEID